METLTLTQALDILEDGNFHSLAFVTADRTKKTGGKIIRIDAGRIVRHKQGHLSSNDEDINLKSKKPQNHSANATRNLTLENGENRKFHIHTLFTVNNLQVI